MEMMTLGSSDSTRPMPLYMGPIQSWEEHPNRLLNRPIRICTNLNESTGENFVRISSLNYTLVASFPTGSECELQESVAAVAGCACYEHGCWFFRAAVGFVFILRVCVGVSRRLREPMCGVAFTGAGLLSVEPVEGVCLLVVPLLRCIAWLPCVLVRFPRTVYCCPGEGFSQDCSALFSSIVVLPQGLSCALEALVTVWCVALSARGGRSGALCCVLLRADMVVALLKLSVFIMLLWWVSGGESLSFSLELFQAIGAVVYCTLSVFLSLLCVLCLEGWGRYGLSCPS
ncbi:hypothetical protein Taro_032067 [Colocasia esculenta]|uniref:Uncharacterized protein n=1 Tax=Colocasia esculenta TaxID=4460 RepID=A0A843VTS6_COLES|nr:hypothetical protein [Colocasia esculenta]